MGQWGSGGKSGPGPSGGSLALPGGFLWLEHAVLTLGLPARSGERTQALNLSFGSQQLGDLGQVCLLPHGYIM